MPLTAAVEPRPSVVSQRAEGGGVGVDGEGARAGDGGVVAVALAVIGGGREPLLRVVEGALGWVVVDPGDPVLPARCVIADVAAVSAGLVPAGVPLVLLVESGGEHGDGRADGPEDGLAARRGVDALAVARAARDAVAVLDGLPSAERLREVVQGVAVEDGGAPWCVLAGAAGGVGTTTVALAVAGLHAWEHGRTVVATRGPAHLAGVPAVAASDLASPAVWAAAMPAVGVRDLRVVGVVGPAAAVRAGDAALVLDAGVAGAGDHHLDVLVLRADRAGVDALASSAAALAVVVGRGAMAPADVRAAAGGRPVVELASSARVARACAAGRMPTDAPGTWLRPLSAVVELLAAREVAP